VIWQVAGILGGNTTVGQNLRRRVKSVPGGDHSARRKRGISRAARGAVPESSNADRREPDKSRAIYERANNNPVAYRCQCFAA